ncbi:uncharacterized protein LOC126996858 [Eriocheir sinensis]|uniref:uncharacterized protein LOC126996858 n=1 Tax=Eriocheir sinensis TaxID=95602 RepID=UPI0021C74040|nr:uncharacterized protein LOC126996858 [Eriocheir sinensis]XP_050713702.1 uncharacterized protein LOC126996858 [Eriocheir sinensis]XP_050713703.1 uncharacterized protein LOC126996858 [Eriocheir sinensis]XP_050713704.1 uncharacterized protein LOC126996858 [Eriocheir sinensis]XP_050713705.1 uncharacterized protein LOC126996858 [Eriocheir sinensis]XP_050713706.1 uncharacterized protein LOC126996858 [Eriocheir sinensis]XP_050713707.1 uncharacterized protein LOC126996858 [Eriocheir sinensis]XP_0
MGCGRSSLGSDSPKKNKKNAEGDSECDSDGDSTSSGGGGSGSRKQQLSNKLVALGAGGPLLAQAKISESQQDFFLMLDEKIENGPDYDSETEEVDRRRRFRQSTQQWGSTITSQPATPANDTPVRLPEEDTGGSGDITEDDEEEEEEEEPGRIPDEAVKEQYMFMGNLYTLTHIRTDSDKTEPKVDMVEVKEGVEGMGLVEEMGHKLNGSAVQEENGVIEEEEEAADGKLQAKSSPRSPRPASLILRSVLPADTVQE